MDERRADYSLVSLLKYCDELGNSGQMKKNTASAMKTACEKLLVNLSDGEKEDVRKIDVEAAAEKYSKTNVAKPKTCREYLRRVRAVIGRFKAQMEDFEAVHPPVEVDSSPEVSSTNTEAEKLVKVKPARVPKETPSCTSMILNIPVRSDFVAQLVLPYDLTVAEAARLSKIIEDLPMSKE